MFLSLLFNLLRVILSLILLFSFFLTLCISLNISFSLSLSVSLLLISNSHFLTQYPFFLSLYLFLSFFNIFSLILSLSLYSLFLSIHLSFSHCSGCLGPFCIVNYYIKRSKTSWTHSIFDYFPLLFFFRITREESAR